MAIVKMNQFTLLTFDTYKEELLKVLQKFENVHFKDLQGENPEEFSSLKKDNARETTSYYESELAKIQFTLERLKPYADIPTGFKAYTTPLKTLSFEEFNNYIQNYDYGDVYQKIKEQDEKLKIYKAEKNKLKTDNDTLKNWMKLDISIAQLAQLKTVSYFLGVISKTDPKVFSETLASKFVGGCHVETLGSSKEETYVLIITMEEDLEEASVHLKNLGFSKVGISLEQIPAVQVDMNHKRISDLERSEQEALQNIAHYGGEYNKLLIVQDYYQTAMERSKASDYFLKTEKTVLIEGWAPTEMMSELKSIVSKVCDEDFHLEEKAVEKDSVDVPIKLKNNSVVSPYESITKMYSLPKYNEVDPTPLLMPFYTGFFGLMVGDLGYGLLLFVLCAFAINKLVLSEGIKNFLKFFFRLSFAIMAAGVLYGSFFGFTLIKPISHIDPETGLKVFGPILDTQDDIVVMIILSIAIGVFQILFGLCVKGYILLRDGKPFSALFDSGFWILTLLSGIGLLLGAAGMIPANFTSICLWLFFAMLVGLAATQGRESPSLGGKIGNGLYAVYGLTSYVGDIVSYTRIVALALSGAYIAYAFNLMAGLMPNMVTKVTFGVLIFLFGNILNFGLSLLSAYVHACRLQYVEYFGKFYEGGGKSFNPLKPIIKSINIK